MRVQEQPHALVPEHIPLISRGCTVAKTKTRCTCEQVLCACQCCQWQDLLQRRAPYRSPCSRSESHIEHLGRSFIMGDPVSSNPRRSSRVSLRHATFIDPQTGARLNRSFTLHNDTDRSSCCIPLFVPQETSLWNRRITSEVLN